MSDAPPPDRPTPISVFDLDRTLTRRGTYLPFLMSSALRLHPWRLATLPAVAVLMAAHKGGLLGRRRLKELMQRLLLGPSVPAIDARRLAHRFADRLLVRGLHPQARAQIDAERVAGRRVVIATAALDLYARPLADLLGVEHLVATRSVWEHGRLVARIDGANAYGAEKLAGLERFLSAQGLDGAAVHLRVFSDDASDRPLFERCDDPVAVNPTAALRRLARERGWRVLDWRTSGYPAPDSDVAEATR